MPHQCLKCGETFQEGSKTILKGCPKCGGTTFFFTEKPLSNGERKRLTELASKDTSFLIRELLRKGVLDYKAIQEEKWLKLVPREVKREEVIRVKEKILKGVKKPKFVPTEIPKPRVKKVKKKKLEKPETPEIPEPPKPVKGAEVETFIKGVVERPPEVVNIIEAGVYEIDVKSLLEKNPIVVRRDGTYLVHLPSIFERLRKKV